MNTDQVRAIMTGLQADGVKLSVVDGGLEVKAARGVLKPDTLAVLKQHKATFIDILTRDTTAPTLPAWCQTGCPSMEVIEGVGPGCVRSIPGGPWSEEWRRLDGMAACPKRMH